MKYELALAIHEARLADVNFLRVDKVTSLFTDRWPVVEARRAMRITDDVLLHQEGIDMSDSYFEDEDNG